MNVGSVFQITFKMSLSVIKYILIALLSHSLISPLCTCFSNHKMRNLRGWKKGLSMLCKNSGISFIKHTKARSCIRVIFFRFIKPCVHQNLCKNPFINPSQGKSAHTCISTPSPPRNHHIWSLQRLVLLCITSSAYHFHLYPHPSDTMFNTIKGTRH